MDDRRQRNQELEDLKQIMRSLIESNGNKMSIRSLIYEYKDMNGKDIPFRRFGFSTVEELIRDMSDSFGIEVKEKDRNYWDFCVFCKTNENTKHLMDLIANQRGSEEVVKEVLKPFTRGLNHKTKVQKRVTNGKPFPLIVQPLNQNSDLDLNELRVSTDFRHSGRQAVCPLPNSRIIPNEVKQMIFELLLKYKSLVLSNFPVAYRLFHNSDIVHTFQDFGYNSLEELLKELSDLVVLEMTSNVIKVKLVAELPSNPMPTHNLTQSPPKPSVLSLKPRNQLLSQKNDFKCTQNIDSNSVHKHVVTNGVTNGHTIPDPDCAVICVDHKPEGNNKTDKQNNHLFNSRKLREESKKFLQILRSNSNGISDQRFVKQYYKQFGRPLSADEWGFGSVIEVFANLNHVFYMKKVTNSALNTERYLLFEATPELMAKTRVLKQKTKRFDQTFKERVYEVIDKCSQIGNHLFVDEFVIAYRLLYNEVIDPKFFGYKDINELLNELSKQMDFDIKEKIKNRPYLRSRSDNGLCLQ